MLSPLHVQHNQNCFWVDGDGLVEGDELLPRGGLASKPDYHSSWSTGPINDKFVANSLQLNKLKQCRMMMGMEADFRGA